MLQASPPVFNACKIRRPRALKWSSRQNAPRRPSARVGRQCSRRCKQNGVAVRVHRLRPNEMGTGFHPSRRTRSMAYRAVPGLPRQAPQMASGPSPGPRLDLVGRGRTLARRAEGMLVGRVGDRGKGPFPGSRRWVRPLALSRRPNYAVTLAAPERVPRAGSTSPPVGRRITGHSRFLLGDRYGRLPASPRRGFGRGTRSGRPRSGRVVPGRCWLPTVPATPAPGRRTWRSSIRTPTQAFAPGLDGARRFRKRGAGRFRRREPPAWDI